MLGRQVGGKGGKWKLSGQFLNTCCKKRLIEESASDYTDASVFTFHSCAADCTDRALFNWNLVVCSTSFLQNLTYWSLTPICTHTNACTHWYVGISRMHSTQHYAHSDAGLGLTWVVMFHLSVFERAYTTVCVCLPIWAFISKLEFIWRFTWFEAKLYR